ncbi:MAG: class I SAM-dependent RNA methyltransferase [Lachnospiraceae bacterium]|nr:class I SAM-dependent RNA methyltransferase [Lachnospiraceae bacterium]
MTTFDLVAPCHFGLEAVLKKEITDLGYEVTLVQDGRVMFAGDTEAIARANVFLRTAERVLLQVGSFRAETFDELFEATKALAWEEFLPFNAAFWVTKASSVKSKLFSPSDIQSIMKKAMVERMKGKYHLEHFPESGASYPVRVFLMKDEVSVCLDTTGESLHKRGYRKMQGEAPIAENLAAALLKLTPFRGDRILVDPFCGSGTIPIEAALAAANIAPGMKRDFTAMSWTNLIERRLFTEVREEAQSLVKTDIETDIQGYDIDKDLIEVAKKNALDAGVAHLIHFQARDVKDLSHRKPYGFIVTNPPYGERIGEEKALGELYRTLGERWQALEDWSLYVITAFMDAERYIGKKAAKNRKIYNGMIKTYFYQYPGAKPPARRREHS